MTAYNVVRMRVKEGREQEFIDINWQVDPEAMKGLKKISIVSTGDRNYCLIGEWEDADAIAGAGPIMISALDTFRDTLEDLWNTNPLLRNYLGSIDNPELIVYKVVPNRVSYMQEWALEYHDVPLQDG